MSYHPLTQETGSDSLGRRIEADKLICIIESSAEYILQGTAREKVFIDEVKNNKPITAKMLFWLRDIKDKYL